MCRKVVSYADFKAILTLFSEVIGNLYCTLSERMERQTTLSIAGQTSLHKSLSPKKEKYRTAIKPTVP